MTTGSVAASRVLVVEDNTYVAMEVAEILTALGYEVIGPAPDVKRATSLLDDLDRVDLGILDINLGETTSKPVYTRLRARHVPVLVLTGNDAGAADEGMLDAIVIEKPFDPESLEAAVDRCLRQGRAENGTPGVFG